VEERKPVKKDGELLNLQKNLSVMQKERMRMENGDTKSLVKRYAMTERFRALLFFFFDIIVDYFARHEVRMLAPFHLPAHSDATVSGDVG